ncbi:sugar-binding protein, partial [Paracidovorax sp. MALMAid1276]
TTTTTTTPNTDLQIHQFGYSDSGELLNTQGWELGTEASTALINAWLQLSTEQLRTVLNQQHDPQALASSPWLQNLQVQHLQPISRVDLQLDALGRTAGEVQTLHRPGTSTIEFEHRIHHRLGALGERQASELQGIGQIDWLTYGSGYVHGVLLNQTPLLALERDKLHREVGRSLHLLQSGAAHEHAPAAITQTRQLDPLG